MLVETQGYLNQYKSCDYGCCRVIYDEKYPSEIRINYRVALIMLFYHYIAPLNNVA